MKNLIFSIITLAVLIAPTAAFAKSGTLMLTTPITGVTDGSLDIIAEYSFTESFALGLDYNSTASRPFVRYYFDGGGDSFFLGAGYLMTDSSTSTSSDSNFTIEGGYNWKWDLFTAEIGYGTNSAGDENGLILRIGLYF